MDDQVIKLLTTTEPIWPNAKEIIKIVREKHEKLHSCNPNFTATKLTDSTQITESPVVAAVAMFQGCNAYSNAMWSDCSLVISVLEIGCCMPENLRERKVTPELIRELSCKMLDVNYSQIPGKIQQVKDSVPNALFILFVLKLTSICPKITKCRIIQDAFPNLLESASSALLALNEICKQDCSGIFPGIMTMQYFKCNTPQEFSNYEGAVKHFLQTLKQHKETLLPGCCHDKLWCAINYTSKVIFNDIMGHSAGPAFVVRNVIVRILFYSLLVSWFFVQCHKENLDEDEAQIILRSLSHQKIMGLYVLYRAQLPQVMKQLLQNTDALEKLGDPIVQMILFRFDSFADFRIKFEAKNLDDFLEEVRTEMLLPENMHYAWKASSTTTEEDFI